jgi:hypothetical protein
MISESDSLSYLLPFMSYLVESLKSRDYVVFAFQKMNSSLNSLFQRPSTEILNFKFKSRQKIEN